MTKGWCRKVLGQEMPEYVALGVIKSESSDVSANYREGIIWVGVPSHTEQSTTWARMLGEGRVHAT